MRERGGEGENDESFSRLSILKRKQELEEFRSRINDVKLSYLDRLQKNAMSSLIKVAVPNSFASIYSSRSKISNGNHPSTISPLNNFSINQYFNRGNKKPSQSHKTPLNLVLTRTTAKRPTKNINIDTMNIE